MRNKSPKCQRNAERSSSNTEGVKWACEVLGCWREGWGTDKAYFEYATMTRSDEFIDNVDTAFKVKYLYR